MVIDMSKEIKRVNREIVKAFDESESYQTYKSAVLRIWKDCDLSWEVFKRLVDNVSAIKY